MRGPTLFKAAGAALLLLATPVLTMPGLQPTASLPEANQAVATTPEDEPVDLTRGLDSRRSRSSAFVTLQSPVLPRKDREPDLLFPHLQFSRSRPRCDEIRAHLMHFFLDAKGGAYTYTFDGPKIVSVAWSYDCSDPSDSAPFLQGTLFVTFYVANTIGVDRSFAVNFRQANLQEKSIPQIVSIHGAAHHVFSSDEFSEYRAKGTKPIVTGPEVFLQPPAPEFSSLRGLEHTLAVTRAKIELLLSRGRGKTSGASSPEVDSSASEPSAKHDNGNESNRPATPIVHIDDQPPLPLAQDEDESEYTPPASSDMHTASYPPDQREHPLTLAGHKPTQVVIPGSQATPIAEQLASLLGDQDLFTVLGAAVVFFAVLSLFCVSFLHRRLLAKTKECDHQHHHRRRWWRGTRRHETVAERLARRCNRRHARVEAVKAWFRVVFGRLFGDEEKEGIARQQPLVQQEIQPRVTQTVVDEDSTTMEQELARFREAATMVGNLVAAEEGRSRTQPARPAPPRPRQRVSLESEGFVSDDESLPTYEESAPSGLSVQDGFRYTAGPHPFIPSTPSDDTSSDANNSDRLGYNK